MIPKDELIQIIENSLVGFWAKRYYDLFPLDVKDYASVQSQFELLVQEILKKYKRDGKD